MRKILKNLREKKRKRRNVCKRRKERLRIDMGKEGKEGRIKM